MTIKVLKHLWINPGEMKVYRETDEVFFLLMLPVLKFFTFKAFQMTFQYLDFLKAGEATNSAYIREPTECLFRIEWMSSSLTWFFLLIVIGLYFGIHSTKTFGKVSNLRLTTQFKCHYDSTSYKVAYLIKIQDFNGK